ncbi:hypothetical protein CVT26_006390 [Gymnopilus dilepis]|uniref:DUF6534 domain-containing protein n=1 Tax=Gymnopilus dilepis TaxID=231916 RepID=A0A409Y0N3_9AGAR|nr:hypothetical protein CVT26_006390 [Gymnopilus dilepis]
MSNATALPPIPADIAATTAPQLIGTLINWFLFGVLSVQVYIYYLNFSDDSIRNKLLVYGAYIVEVVQTAMTGGDIYFWYASGYGNLSHLDDVNLGPADTPILCGIIASIVQCFFAYRIYTLRKSLAWVSILVVLTSALQVAGAVGAADRIWLIADVVCDILIATTLLWLLYKSRKEGSMYGSQVLAKLVRLVVETNTLTASMALVSFICYVTLPNSPLFVCTTLIMGKLYSNTLLATVNNRILLRKMDTSNIVIQDISEFRVTAKLAAGSQGSGVTYSTSQETAV